MKRRVLKIWSERLLIVIDIIAFILLSSEEDNLIDFCVVHIIATIVLFITSYILIKYGRND